MNKSFQKSAKILQELHQPHPGIIDLDNFNKYFRLRCYEPSLDLRPFVAHIWTQRLHTTPDHAPIEITTGPNIYLFFTSESAFINDIDKHGFKYNPLASEVIVGVKFRPGGFYPFIRRPVCQLKAHTTDIQSVFPAADELFRATLLSQSDEGAVAMLETLLRDVRPQHNKKLDLIAKILAALEDNTSLQSVEAVARAFGISERSLQLLFQTYVGVGLKWVITRRRLLEAIAQVQAQPHRSWADVAAELGYSSQSHFSREFKKVIGLSPSQYLRVISPTFSSTDYSSPLGQTRQHPA
ncbi:MAG TPA: helix-turn-helix domain-containing protein [Candidatus Saccharimonadales bacterium]